MRVLVVDDSVVMRRIVARALERDPQIDRTDFASNGRLALLRIADRRPDVVVLDLEMPELDGFGTLAEIRRTDPTLPVVLFSTVNEAVARATLDALSVGAIDFVLKPSAGSVDAAEAYVAEHLTPLVKALAPRATSAPRRIRNSVPTVARTGKQAVRAVVIGVSTGGPDALAVLMRALPAELPVPVLIVQHMPPMFTKLLAERLGRLGRLSVVEAADGDLLVEGTVYIAPGDRHLALSSVGGEMRVRLDDGAPENSCRPAADVLFRAAADAFGAGVLAVVLTGMGHDGRRGCELVRAAGGQVVVQDPDTAVIGSMPAAVADAGLADAILPLELLVPELVERILSGRGR